MPARTLITLLAAFSVTSCYLNCIRSKADTAKYYRLVNESAAAGDTDPVLPFQPPGCENEFGCICKGVVFEAPPCFEVQDLTVWSPLADLACFSTALVHSPELTRRAAEDHFHTRPPISGRALRAWISSLVI